MDLNKLEVLLDGGASHNVFYGPSIPEGSKEKSVDLAHGSKQGYVKDFDITFIDPTVSPAEAETPAIISLGRLISLGTKLDWSKDGAYLTLPGCRRTRVLFKNY